ncbi:hypothetical protein ACKKBG_A31475 [Auxenochlorella protothecoides x Auxenochlorella symbiontica]|uniref:gamma-glutamylcyclotransferase n=1 Tax=Auxenochlorella protothecoides TaxID=3075 RepID=A0A3M7KU47_AUXPR|nr:hypothetical protein APUTEX25_004862 [Auxenochlorella protothecoides]|eukprot:RMZ53374.1 hypothetical protein APUTEX25_004862 [Auxenochlorella protothecoides]
MTAPADKLTEEIAEQVDDRTGIHITSGPRKEVEDAPADIWYFAFGSNLADSVLRGRRSITPAETVGARLPGYRLAFTLQALPYREPAMASVERIPTESPPVSNGAAHAADAAGARRRGPAGAEPWSQGPEKGGAEDRQEVHGALYRLTQGQWDYICETEGAAGSKQSDYEILEVEAEAYDGRRIEARTLTTSERALRFRNGRKLLPSKRYLTIIRTGAAERGLHAEYLAYLDSLQHYQARTLGQKVMGTLFLGILFSFFGLFAAVKLKRRIMGEVPGVSKKDAGPRLLPQLFHALAKASWALHDILEPVMGSGAC